MGYLTLKHAESLVTVSGNMDGGSSFTFKFAAGLPIISKQEI